MRASPAPTASGWIARRRGTRPGTRCSPGRREPFRLEERRLPGIAAMGFTVVYLPPIHPIGTTHRKGRNDTVECAPGDPGSPWAIGSAAGGHTAGHPDLGSI